MTAKRFLRLQKTVETVGTPTGAGDVSLKGYANDRKNRNLRGVDAAIAMLALGTLISLLAGCSRGEAHPKLTPPAVTVAPVERKELVEWDEFTGRTEAIENVEVRPRVSGHIDEVRFESGKLVKKGDVLFVIDPR